jgi:asparagine synthase (glutamine-hydrolysing)
MFFGRISVSPRGIPADLAGVLEGMPCAKKSHLKRVYADERAVIYSDGVDGSISGFIPGTQTFVIGHASLVSGETRNHRSHSPEAVSPQLVLGGIEFQTDGLREIDGEFCIASWDAHGNRLRLVRDFFGIRQMYFRDDGETIWFSDTASQIAASKPRQTRADVADMFMGIAPSGRETSFPGVRYLPPAHMLTKVGRDTRVEPYWQIELRDTRVFEPEVEMLERFTAAVDRRLTSGDRTAAMLSGGIDSTSMSMIAGRKLQRDNAARLRTYSCVYPQNPKLDESRFINAAIRDGYLAPCKLPFDGHDPLEGVAETQLGLGRLSIAAGLNKTRKLIRYARDEGYDQIFHGHGGDEVISHGREHIMALAKQAEWSRLLPLVVAYAKKQNENPFELLFKLARGANPTLPTRAIRRVLRMILSVPPTNLTEKDQPLVPELVADVDAHSRHRSSDPWQQDEPDYARKVHRAMMMSGMVPVAFETLGWAAQRENVTFVYPFFDRELVDFCVNLQGEEKIRRGETRSILKRALKDILPLEVARRNDKVDFSSEIAEGLQKYHDERLRELKAGHPRLKSLFNQEVLTRAVQNVQDLGRHAQARDSTLVWRAASVAILVDENGDKFDLDL